MNKKIISLMFLLAFFYVSIIFIVWQNPINRGIVANNSNFKQQSYHPRNIIDIVETKETLRTSNPGPQLNYYSFQVDDDNSGNSNGDADGNIDAGETIELRLMLNNSGDEDALNVNATLSSSDNNVTITNDFQDFINIPQSSTGVSSTFYIFEIVSSCPSDYNITFDLQINASNGGPWNDNFQIHIIGKGNPVYQSFSVISESDGDLTADDDEIIDPGEVIVFDIKIKNVGGAHIYGITGVINENDPYTNTDDNSGDFGTINSNGDTAIGRFGITVSGACPDKHQIDFDLNLTDAESTKWQVAFNIIINGTSEYLMMGFSFIQYSGNGDNEIDAKEKWYTNVTIKNIGAAIGKNIYIFLDSSDSYISFYEETRNKAVGNININETGSYDYSDSWRFTVSENVPYGRKITISVRITDSLGVLQYFNIELEISGKTTAYEILDIDFEERQGNGDANIDKGEDWNMIIVVKSIGQIIASNVYAFLECNDDYLSFSSPQEDKDRSTKEELNPNYIETDEGARQEWGFDIKSNTPSNKDIEITIKIFDTTGNYLEFEKKITVIAGVDEFDWSTIFPPIELQLLIFAISLSVVIGIIIVIELIGRYRF